MRRNKVIICILTVFFLALSVVVCIFPSQKDEEIPFSVTLLHNGNAQEIRCYGSEDNRCYFFLPAYADLSMLKINLNTQDRVNVNGSILSDGMSCEKFQLDKTYTLSYEQWGKNVQKNITFMKSADVAAMYISTESGNMDYIHFKKGNKESGNLGLYSANGNLNYLGKIDSINGRGNNSWDSFDKKSYSITLTDDADLLEMGAAKEWILLSNAADESNLRNKLSYDFADKMGLKYSPNSQYVDLYLNGEYAGLYLLCERNEIHSNRVNIAQNGGFVVSLETEDKLIADNCIYFSTNADKFLRVHSPKRPSDEQMNAISERIQSAENAIISENGIDSVTGKSWQELIDVESWARKYLIEEAFGNLDGGLISQYFYCDADSNLIFAGPVWDFDHSLGNDLDTAWNVTNPNVSVINLYNENQWFINLYQKDVFRARLVELYEKEYLPLLEDFLNNDIDEYAARIKQASKLDAVRWGHDEDLSSHTQKIKSYLKQHSIFLGKVWLENAEYCQVAADNLYGNSLYFTVTPGQTAPDLPHLEDTETAQFLGWYYFDTDEPFDSNKPIYEDVRIYAKWQENWHSKTDDVLKLVPICVIAVLFVVILVFAVKRIKESG